MFDTGGGSSQFTFGRGEQVDERFSVDVGAVRYTEGSGSTAWSPRVLAEALAAIDADLGGSPADPRPRRWSHGRGGHEHRRRQARDGRV